jgi:twitching motility two-component system response regulator PilH
LSVYRQDLDVAGNASAETPRDQTRDGGTALACVVAWDFCAGVEVFMERRVLVVEDNDDWRAIMTLFLTRLGYSVLQASNGVEAIERATGELPHLILMDLKLPKLSGLEATAQIKENSATTDIPVVLCTAFGPEAYENNPNVSYLAEVVQKPIKLDAFQALVQKYLPLPTPGLVARTL